MSEIRFLLTGDTSLCAEFGNEISPEINRNIRAFGLLIQESRIPGIVETVPSYRSLMIHYDPEIISFRRLMAVLKRLTEKLDSESLPPGEVLEIPVLYGGEMGPDLAFVAEHAGLSPEEVVKIHTAAPYLIYMLGFTPGFAYLGGMSDRLETPRLTTPRVKIPAGSVGIAGKQTGVYPIDSPGGWQLIGRTPVRMYAPDREIPILPKAGQYIRFCSIDQKEYDRIAAQEASGTYRPAIRPYEDPETPPFR